MQTGTMDALLDFSAWAGWIRSLNAGWLFVLILAVVIIVVALWSRGLKSDKIDESQYK